MNIEQKKQLIAYLETFVTENKKEKMLHVLPERTRRVTLALENMSHSHNASAVVRTAECLGVQDIHIVQGTVRFKALEGIAQGAAQWLDLHGYATTAKCFDALRANNYRIIAMTPHTHACDLPDFKVEGNMAFVFGTELEGISDYTLKNADEYVKIPMYGFTESFNVSVSVGITLYYVMQQLRSMKNSWRLSEEEIIDVKLAWLRRLIRGSQHLEKKFWDQHK